MRSTFFLPFLTVLILLSACITDNKINAIDPYYVFHNNCSKVWLIDHCYKAGKDYAPLSQKYKEIITFHDSRNCYVQRMNTFGDEPGKKGIFYVSGEKKTLSIDFENHKSWKFTVKFLSHIKIILVPLDNNFEYTLELIPVPEPS